MSVVLNHYENRMLLYRELGIMELDNCGMWIDKPINEADWLIEEQCPLPPEVPDEWLNRGRHWRRSSARSLLGARGERRTAGSIQDAAATAEGQGWRRRPRRRTRRSPSAGSRGPRSTLGAGRQIARAGQTNAAPRKLSQLLLPKKEDEQGPPQANARSA